MRLALLLLLALPAFAQDVPTPTATTTPFAGCCAKPDNSCINGSAIRCDYPGATPHPGDFACLTNLGSSLTWCQPPRATYTPVPTKKPKPTKEPKA